ncbi:hypothetical protein [Winogradskyella damuponensis]|uniref:hypothetical protein n=1 Tax=Winogradskyella damuponensis TaxID=943939 RepID=UPI0031DBBD40
MNSILKTFKEHQISQYSELKILEFNKSEHYPISEGIQFESNHFAGEIFYYSSDKMKYCEMEFLIYLGENYKAKVVEETDIKEIENKIAEFLTKRMTELKNVA